MDKIEKQVKDKALFYWLDTEITMIHIAIYWIFALLIDGWWSTFVAVVFTAISLVYLGRLQQKINKLND